MDTICKSHKNCGGCELQGKTYQEQLKYKESIVRDLLSSTVSLNRIDSIIGMENPYYYRNKGKYAFHYYKNKKQIQMGFFKEGTHQIIEEKNCMIQNETINQVAEKILELVDKYHIQIYDEDTKKGFLRHVVIRIGVKTNEIMIIFVTTKGKISHRDVIIKELINQFPNIKTVVQNMNEKETNAILGKETIKLYGNGFIVDYLKQYKFKISPVSFYQVNPIQTEKLYQTAIDFAELSGKEIVYDLYSGIGTISLFISKHVRKVYGIEIVEDAVKDAKENARLNHITNTEFISGRVEIVLPKMEKRGIHPDVIFVDPPRSGLDQKTIETILDIQPKKMIYISCNPETLKDNLVSLKQKYEIKKVQLVDMFPFTKHCEIVVALNLK